MVLSVRSACLILALALPLAPAEAGQRTAAAQPAGVAQARAALAAGRAAEALALADAVLGQQPLQQEANELKIKALLSLGRLDGAFGAYDQYADRSGREMAPWLRELATAELRRTGTDGTRDPLVRTAALERLARAGDKAARADLERDSTAHMLSPEGLATDAALARLGDPAAAARIASMAAPNAVRDGSVVAEALQAAGAKKQAYVLVPMLADPSPVARMAAAEALGVLGHGDAIPALRELLNDVQWPIRVKAAIALRRLGDTSGEKVLAASASAGMPDLPILAFEAGGAAVAREAPAVKALLSHADPLIRLHAAEALGRAGVELEASRASVTKLLGSPDQGLRREAARVYERLGPPDLGVCHRLLKDRDGWVRTYAAGVLLAAPAK